MEFEKEKELILEAETKLLKLVTEVLEKIDNDDNAVIMVVDDCGYVMMVVDVFLGVVRVSAPVFPVTVEEVKESYVCPQCGATHVGQFYVYKLPNY